MKKRNLFYSLFALLVCCYMLTFGISTTFAVGVKAAYDYDVEVSENIVQNEPGKYTLYENYAKFDGTVYEYNLDAFFDGSSTKFYTYKITSGNIKEGSVVVEENILRIVPQNTISDTIVIEATDRNGDSFDAEFALKYIDATAYVTQKIIFVMAWVLILFLILLAANVCVPFRGSVNVTALMDGSSVALKKILGVAVVPRKFAVSGRIFGRNGSHIKFVPDGDAYIMTENGAKKIRAVRVDCGEEIKLYSDETCKDGIEVYFYKKY